MNSDNLIIDPVMEIVHDAFDFQRSELCNNLRKTGHPPYYWKHVKINTHRRAGFTSAALKLQQIYTSTLIITHQHGAKRNVWYLAEELGLYEPWIQDQTKAAWEVFETNYFRALKAEQRHQLIIIDPMSMVKQELKSRVHEFRDYLFHHCDLLVELG